MKKKWLNTTEVAEYLGVKKVTIYKWVYESRVPNHKIPGSHLLRFYEPEIDQWIINREGNECD